jgi:FtsH-binding integral membrane protein
MLGAAVSNAWGMSSAFLVTAGIFGAMSALVATFVRVPESTAEQEPTASAPA